MTPEQRRLVHDSWARAAASTDELARRFYARLFEIDPSAALLFASVDMPTQRAKFVHMLFAVVGGELSELVAGAAALGRRHAGYGASDGHYESVRESLLSALDATLGTAFTPAVRAACGRVRARGVGDAPRGSPGARARRVVRPDTGFCHPCRRPARAFGRSRPLARSSPLTADTGCAGGSLNRRPRDAHHGRTRTFPRRVDRSP